MEVATMAAICGGKTSLGGIHLPLTRPFALALAVSGASPPPAAARGRHGTQLWSLERRRNTLDMPLALPRSSSVRHPAFPSDCCHFPKKRSASASINANDNDRSCYKEKWESLTNFGQTIAKTLSVGVMCGALVCSDLAALLPQQRTFTSDIDGQFLLSTNPLVVVGGAAQAAETTYASPYNERNQMDTGLLGGRIRPCPTAINPNCVSSSSINDAYTPPWETPAFTVTEASMAVQNVVDKLFPSGELVESALLPQGSYFLEYQIPGRFGPDVLEILIRKAEEDGEPADSRAERVVLIRSLATKIIYVYPFTTPIGDFGKQRERINSIRKELGWRLVGCELLECYE